MMDKAASLHFAASFPSRIDLLIQGCWFQKKNYTASTTKKQTILNQHIDPNSLHPRMVTAGHFLSPAITPRSI
jgi:hypothetical protein